MSTIFHFTIDCDWIPNSEKSLPEIFRIISKFNIKPTFFLTGKFALECKEYVEEMKHRNYEIGSHGFCHGLDATENFGRMVSYNEQKRILTESSEIINKVAGIDPYIFRAPKLNISSQTFKVLKDLNYKIDSSIPAKRFDFGLGSINHFDYINKKNEPFLVNNSILEIPPSAFILPLNMRLLRVLGAKFALKIFEVVHLTTNVIVFYVHPAEFVSASGIKYPKTDNRFYKNCGALHFDALEEFLENVFNKNIISQNMADHLGQKYS